MATRRTIGRAATAMSVVATLVLGPVAQAVAESNGPRPRNAPGTDAPRHPVAGAATTRSTSTEPPVLTGVSTADLTSTLTTHALSIDQPGGALRLPYCGNGDVLSANTAVHTVVVVVHGTNRNACDYAQYVVESAALASGLAGTLVVAPHFQADADLTASDTTTLYWSEDGWKSGSRSLRSPLARPWSMSSYEALDRLVGTVADRTRFPGLQRVVVAGHSAGGQFVNRYAASTRLSGATPGVPRRFVIANPSSYLYFDSRRSDGSRLRHLTAAEARACPDHDHYKYGLQHRYAFLADLDTATLKERYAASDVRYLLGDRDTSTTSSTLDTSCAATWQGAHRLQRGQRYYASLDEVLGADVHDRHRLAVVPGVGHDGRRMLSSVAGRAALFG